MCGIGGKISFTSRPDSTLGDAMTTCMTNRGPDAEGIYANGPALLAHSRLSILDLSEAGNQPMSNADDTVHIVFNGEIYNYRELHERVDHYPFQSETDTEVLLHLYEEYGVDCLQDLRGMYAFAVWDERKERLFLARDRLGQKPLFYRHEDGTFWFGSTIKAILADDTVTPAPDLSAIREYLTYQYTPHPSTGFESIQQLRPAEYLIVDEEGIERDRYWSVSYAAQSDASISTLAMQLREKLREATRLRMRSDVPVGVFLSGGIDSSVVTALMSDLSKDPVNTYSIGFDEDAYDELEFAREVAGLYGTNHHEYTVTPDSMDVFPRLVEEYEMPFGDPSALPTYYVSKVASDDITVVLSGDAGDENFAGYDRYSYDRLTGYVNRIPSTALTTSLAGLLILRSVLGPNTYVKNAERVLHAAKGDEVRQYAEYICHSFRENMNEFWRGPELNDELRTLRTAFEQTDGPTRLDRLMHVDLQTYLPDDLLVKVDRASMAHSLEVRSPFLDHELVEFAASVPSEHKWRRGEKKWLLKRAFKDDLSDKVVNREKQGFSVPVDEWFRGELREFAREKLIALGAREPFDQTGLETQFSEHQSGRDHGYRIWDLVVLEEWYERFIDSQ